jgi:hypothetical protein
MRQAMHELLVSEGYKLVEDSWDKDGRRTYLNDENATRSYLKHLAVALSREGWSSAPDKLRSFLHSGTDESIEIEPGGSETSGHFLHLFAR